VDRIASKVLPIGNKSAKGGLSIIVLPSSESQVRELAKVPESDQAEVWAQVTAKTDNPTAKVVRAAVKSWNKLKAASKPNKKPKPPSEPKPKTVSDEDSLPNGGKAFKRDAPMPEWFMDDNRVAVPVELYPAWRAKQRFFELANQPPSKEVCEAVIALGEELTHHATVELGHELLAKWMQFKADFSREVIRGEPSLLSADKTSWLSKQEVADA